MSAAAIAHPTVRDESGGKVGTMNAAMAAIRTTTPIKGNGPRSLRGGGGAIFGAAVAVPHR